MRGNVLKVLIGLLIALGFLYLAAYNVDWDTTLESLRQMRYGWVVPFVLVTLLAHYIRAERWKLLVETNGATAKRMSLFTAVMFGYLVNFAVPRLGEVSRCVYLGKKEQMKTASVVGTVVLERIIDLLMLALMFIIVFSLIFTDDEKLVQVFGYNPASPTVVGLFVAITVAGLFGAILGLSQRQKLANYLEKNFSSSSILHRLGMMLLSFVEGLVSIKKVKQWPLFLLLSAMMWTCYIAMTYLPFEAFIEQALNERSFGDAIIVMCVSTVGIILPSPGAIGTYHWFVVQALTIIFGVTASTAFAYAIASHSATLFVVLIFSPLLLLLNNLKKRTKTEEMT